MRWINFGAGLLFGVILGATSGLIFGVQLGDVNADIDFCADSGSPRYIYDDLVRRDVC